MADGLRSVLCDERCESGDGGRAGDGVSGEKAVINKTSQTDEDVDIVDILRDRNK